MDRRTLEKANELVQDIEAIEMILDSKALISIYINNNNGLPFSVRIPESIKHNIYYLFRKELDKKKEELKKL